MSILPSSTMSISQKLQKYYKEINEVGDSKDKINLISNRCLMAAAEMFEKSNPRKQDWQTSEADAHILFAHEDLTTVLNLEKSIDYSQIPESIQNVLVGNYSSKIRLGDFLALQMYSLCIDIESCAKKEDRQTIEELKKIIPLFNIFFGLCGINNHTKNKYDINSLLSEFPIRSQLSEIEIKNFLVSLCRNLRGILTPVQSNINEEGKKSVVLLLGIVEEIKKTLLEENGLAFSDYEVRLYKIIATDPPTEDLATVFDSLVKIIQVAKNCLSSYSKIYLQTPTFQREEIKDIVEPFFKSHKSLGNCIQNIKKRKKNLKLGTLQPNSTVELSEYINQLLIPLNEAIRLFLNSEYKINFLYTTDLSLINQEMLNSDLFCNEKLITPTSIKQRLLDTYTFKQIHSILATALSSIFYFSQTAITQPFAKKYSFNKALINHNIKQFKLLQKKLTQNDLKLKSSHIIYTENAPYSIDRVAKKVNLHIQLIEFYLDQDTTHPTLTNLYSECEDLKTKLDSNLNSYLSSMVAEIKGTIKELASIDCRKNKLYEKKLSNLSHSLHRIHCFMNTWDRYSPPVMNTLNNFEASFLQRIEETSEPKEVLPEIFTNATPPTLGTKHEQIESSEEDDSFDTTFISDTSNTSNDKITTDNVLKKIEELEQEQNRAVKKSVRNVKFRELVNEVLKAGYELVRINGSHNQYRNPISNLQVTIPKHPTISPGVVREVRATIDEPGRHVREGKNADKVTAKKSKKGAKSAKKRKK